MPDEAAKSEVATRLPLIDQETLAELQKIRERDPNYIARLLAEAQAKFDQKWGIDPSSETEYDWI